VADKMIVLVQGRRYNSPTAMDSTDLRAFIETMENFGASVLAAGRPEVDATESGWVRFTFTLKDDD
jgi:hypothetical protein